MPKPVKKLLIELVWYAALLVDEGVTDEVGDGVLTVDSKSNGDEWESGEIDGGGVVVVLLLLVNVVNLLTLSLWSKR